MKLENGRFFKITEIYIFISKDKDGNEILMSFKAPNGEIVPMIGADAERVDSLMPLANMVKKRTGIDYEIRYFRYIK